VTSPGEIYAQLFSGAPNESGRAFRAFPCATGLQVRVFVDGLSRLPGLSLRLARSDVPQGLALPKIRGADLTVIGDSEQGRSAEATFQLVAAGERYRDVFVELADSLIDEVCSEATPAGAVLHLARRLATWARFFDARGEEALGRSAQLGLIGELLCLLALEPTLGLQRAVSAWTGPSGTPHDFQTGGGSVEVKLTTSATPERFRVTSERQLDESQVPLLLVFAVRAMESASGPVCLNSLVDEVRGRIVRVAPTAAFEFEDRLLAAGYVDSDRDEYTIRLAVGHQDLLRVEGEFPRIRTGELRTGVFCVSYDVAWASLLPYRVDATEAERLNEH
jgi:hypothetical protein